MARLAGKVAIVTGASKGIGASIAEALAAEGAAVAVNYASSAEGAQRVVSGIKAKGGKAVAIAGDVSNADDVRRLFERTRDELGVPDVLVNNAGVYDFQSIADLSEETFHRQFNINVLGTLLAIREAVKTFGPQGGSVINVSSVVSEKPVPNAAVYSATKGAVDSLTRSLATELGPRNVRVNTIAPGGVETEGTHRLGIVGSDFAKQMVAATPLGRFGQPEDIARVAVFLASDDSRWLTGERITAAGGLS